MENLYIDIAWPIGLVNWVSFVANLATIFALILAVWVLLIWKKQQVFADERSRLLDAEELISEIHLYAFYRFSRAATVAKNTINMNKYSDDKAINKQLFVDDNKNELELYNKDTEVFFKLNNKYQLLKQKLEFMDIVYDDDYDIQSFENYCHEIKIQVLNINNLDELDKFSEKIIYELDEKKKKCLSNIKEFRKKNYS